MKKTLLLLVFLLISNLTQAQTLTYQKKIFYSDNTKISFKEAKEILKSDAYAYKGIVSAYNSKAIGKTFYGFAIGYTAASTVIGLNSDKEFKGGQVVAIGGGLALIGLLLHIGTTKKIETYVDGYEKRKANQTSLSLTGTSQGIGIIFSF